MCNGGVVVLYTYANTDNKVCWDGVHVFDTDGDTDDKLRSSVGVFFVDGKVDNDGVHVFSAVDGPVHAGAIQTQDDP